MRGAVAVVLIAVVLLSGCIGGLGTGDGDGGGTTTTTAPDAETATDGTTDAGADTETGTGSDGEADSPDLAEVVRRHDRAVRNGSHRVEGSFAQEIRTENRTAVVRANYTAVGEVGGHAYVRNNRTRGTSGTTIWELSERYRAPDGSVYMREELQTGATDVYSGERAFPPQLEDRLVVGEPILNMSFEYLGRDAVEGVSGHVWRATSVSPDSNLSGNLDVTAFEATVVARDGRVRYARLEMTGTNPEGDEVWIRFERRWVAFGDADVPEPEWVEEA